MKSCNWLVKNTVKKLNALIAHAPMTAESPEELRDEIEWLKSLNAREIDIEFASWGLTITSNSGVA